MRVWVSLGANLGPARETLVRAVLQLRAKEVSPLYSSAPVGGPDDQPWYLNAVACLDWYRSPWSLLEMFWELEREAGRRRAETNGPRELDLDIVAIDHLRVSSPLLEVPHPRARLRRFVMAPLGDLAPQFVRDWGSGDLVGEVIQVGQWSGSEWVHHEGGNDALHD